MKDYVHTAGLRAFSIFTKSDLIVVHILYSITYSSDKYLSDVLHFEQQNKTKLNSFVVVSHSCSNEHQIGLKKKHQLIWKYLEQGNLMSGVCRNSLLPLSLIKSSSEGTPAFFTLWATAESAMYHTTPTLFIMLLITVIFYSLAEVLNTNTYVLRVLLCNFDGVHPEEWRSYILFTYVFTLHYIYLHIWRLGSTSTE